jgi:hypothetical protein
MEMALPFPRQSKQYGEYSGLINPGMRAWVNESEGAITNWQDFEAYPFPDVSNLIFLLLNILNRQ